MLRLPLMGFRGSVADSLFVSDSLLLCKPRTNYIISDVLSPPWVLKGRHVVCP